MLNQFILVGRIAQDLEIIEQENGGKSTKVLLNIPRSYKNANGEYESDLIECWLYGQVGNTTKRYCKIGDIVGIKGHVQRTETTKEQRLVADKVTFLSSKTSGKEEEN